MVPVIETSAGGIVKRGNIWHYRLRVPVKYKEIEPRQEIFKSLGTSLENVARQNALYLGVKVIEELETRLALGTRVLSQTQFEAAVCTSKSYGFTYKTALELSCGPLEEILARIKVLEDNKHCPSSFEAESLLGSFERPKITVSLCALSMEERFPLEIRDKNPRQRKIWKARWVRPACKVKEVLGYDPIFQDMARFEAIALKDALQDRIIEGDLKGSSAQKDLQNLDLMWNKFHISMGMDVSDIPASPFVGLSKSLGRLDDEGRKNEVPLDWIETVLLSPGALLRVEPILKDVLYVLLETGCRQSEITDLPPSSIFLEDAIPHIWVRHEKGPLAREIKNKASSRKIPLVGLALEAMKRHPTGFSKYRGTGTFSADANRLLRRFHLLPEGVTAGGLRHSFETRLKMCGIESDDRGELMGHSVKRIRQREHYGDSMSLETRLAFHQKIRYPGEQKALMRPV
jgi:hypothetical protein